MARNKLSRVEKTLRLYSPLNPKDPSTLLGFFLQQNPRWSLGTVDSELWEKYRTFNTQTTDWYNFLNGEVEKKFMCIFKFDNVNRKLHCHTVEGATKLTNIFASYENILDNLSIDEKTDGLFTALNCNGAGYLDIRGVNPLGGNIIYNFDYFKNTDWLPLALINKINNWEKKIDSRLAEYNKMITSLREQQLLLTTSETNLVELKTKLAECEQQMAIAWAGEDLARYNTLVSERHGISSQISTQQSDIARLQSTVNSIKEQMVSVNKELSFENNFTQNEIHQLQDITIVDNYINDGFVKTDIMKPYEVQTESLNLYNHCKEVLKTVSSPKYYFNADIVNFIFLKEYEEFTRQVDVGSLITVEIKKGWRTKVVLLSISLDFSNPNNMSLEFSNRHRLDNGRFAFNDIYSDVSYSTGNMDWDKAIISDPVKSGLMNDVNNFMKYNFNAAKNALISAKGIGIIIDGSGLHGRRHDENGVLQGTELWMTNDMIGMSSDNFNTPPQIAIGRFKLPQSDNYACGINAQFLAGRLVVGNQFIFEAENGSFKFDGDGAQLTNAALKVTDINNIRRIIIDPVNGFKIQSRLNPDSQWEDKIYLDNDGNAIFKGEIEALKGIIAGWIIKEDGLYSPFGDYIKSDGTGKISLLSWSRSRADFNGDIYARNLKASVTNGWVGNEHIANNSISAIKLESSYTDGIKQSLSKIETKANENAASIVSLTNHTNETFKTTTSTLRQEISTAQSAAITQSTNYTNEHAASKSEFKQFSDATRSDIALIVSYSGTNFREINTASIVASVNRSGSNIKISADKIDIYGKTTFISNVVGGINNGYTTINGGKITAGTIDASHIKTGTITADKISSSYVYTGRIDADKINAGTLSSVDLQWGSSYMRSNGYRNTWYSPDAIEVKSAQTSITAGSGGITMNNWAIAICNCSQVNINPTNTLYLGGTNTQVYYRGNQLSRRQIKYKDHSGNNLQEWVLCTAMY